MTNSFFIKILFYVGVLEFGAIVTSYFLDLGFKLVLGSFCKFLECFLYYTFVMQKEYPSETRIIINNEKNYICYYQCLYKPPARRDPYGGVQMA